jgi:beta-xylosidase
MILTLEEKVEYIRNSGISEVLVSCYRNKLVYGSTYIKEIEDTLARHEYKDPWWLEHLD